MSSRQAGPCAPGMARNGTASPDGIAEAAASHAPVLIEAYLIKIQINQTKPNTAKAESS